MRSGEGYLSGKLEERKAQGNLRQLRCMDLPYDFVSNDYLGLARSQELASAIRERFDEVGQTNINGAGGSRLLSGNHTYTEELETKIATHFCSDSALIFNSGYAANVGLISSVASRSDTILYDKLSHVCLKEGAWLSRASSASFAHNDLLDLETKLQQASGNVFVVIESVYSMDGDHAPIKDILSLCEKHGANLIVDEAHSTGVSGNNGNGLLNSLGLSDRVFARVYTFGKAMGVHGAAVCGSNTLIEYLINFGRPFIYSTAMPLHSYVSIEQAIDFIAKKPELNKDLAGKIGYVNNALSTMKARNTDFKYPGSNSAIQPMLIPGNAQIKVIADKLQSAGFDVRPILAPTVPAGSERLRLSLHCHNTYNEIDMLLSLLENLI